MPIVFTYSADLFYVPVRLKERDVCHIWVICKFCLDYRYVVFFRMHQYTFAAVVFGVAAVFLSNASTTAYMISCPPNDLLEASPSLRHLCYIVEKAVVDNSISDEPSCGYNFLN